MTAKTTNFSYLGPSETPTPDLFGATTSVRRIQTLSGWDAAEKTLRHDTPHPPHPAIWLGRARHAQRITNEIRALQNPAYNVPRTFISHNHVRDQWADGIPLSKLYGDQYITDHYQSIVTALGQFINDMSELRPVYYKEKPQPIPLWFHTTQVMNETLSGVHSLIPAPDIQLIADTYHQLFTSPDNHIMVFAHADLHPDNILINPETNRVTIIDFERATYVSKFQMMYDYGTTAIKDLWDYINHLPRKTNPDLSWNFDKNTHMLFNLTESAIWELINFSPLNPLDEIRDEFVVKMADICKKIRFYSAQQKLQAPTATATRDPLVPVDHYTKLYERD